MPHYPVGGYDDDDVTSIRQTEPDDSSIEHSRLSSLPAETCGPTKRHRTDGVDQDEIRPSEQVPHPQTPRKQDSEGRDRSEHTFPSLSDLRRPSWLNEPPPPFTLPPSTALPPDHDLTLRDGISNHGPEKVRDAAKGLPLLQIPHLDPSPFVDDETDHRDEEIDRAALLEEYDRRWILNLSMHFRDKSDREKFFVTYAEKPNMWRRITVSLDYREPLPRSLEADIKTLRNQRDKSMRIFEEIRESLAEIQYYDTVTNLKLETSREDHQLHVHVREDVKEIINFPPISLFAHVRCPRFHESALAFDSHLSGFVYKVRLDNRVLIKKEIPGPDTVDEFLYEVNALDALLGRSHVVQLEGLVTDDHGTLVKALLISFAPLGSLVDMIYDLAGSSELPWSRRERWARQIVTGLSHIHEAGFVQGDFTLTNIVIDDEDNAQIIDINRRGCPVGWEPPELGRLIENGQRIGMCIGVKTDIFQLGMVLWALAEEDDEPERNVRPLRPVNRNVPAYFREMVATCLSERPQDRASAKDLITRFPASAGQPSIPGVPDIDFVPGSKVSSISTTHRSDKEYIDPAMAVTIDDVQDRRRSSEHDSQFPMDQVTYVNPESNPTSSTYRFESAGSWIIGRRGRSPISSSRRRRSSPFDRTISSATSFSEISPARHFGADPDPTETRAAKDPDLARFSSELAAGTGYPPPLVDVHPRDLQDPYFPAHLLHIDSGFHEMEQMLDDLQLTDSHITEKGDRNDIREDRNAQSSRRRPTVPRDSPT